MLNTDLAHKALDVFEDRSRPESVRRAALIARVALSTTATPADARGCLVADWPRGAEERLRDDAISLIGTLATS